MGKPPDSRRFSHGARARIPITSVSPLSLAAHGPHMKATTEHSSAACDEGGIAMVKQLLLTTALAAFMVVPVLAQDNSTQPAGQSPTMQTTPPATENQGAPATPPAPTAQDQATPPAPTAQDQAAPATPPAATAEQQVTPPP